MSRSPGAHSFNESRLVTSQHPALLLVMHGEARMHAKREVALMASRREVEVESFQCSRLAGIAHVAREFVSLPGTSFREVARIDCKQKDRCGVVTWAGNAGTPEWTKCVHPALNRRTGG